MSRLAAVRGLNRFIKVVEAVGHHLKVEASVAVVTSLDVVLQSAVVGIHQVVTAEEEEKKQKHTRYD